MAKFSNESSKVKFSWKIRKIGKRVVNLCAAAVVMGGVYLAANASDAISQDAVTAAPIQIDNVANVGVDASEVDIKPAVTEEVRNEISVINSIDPSIQGGAPVDVPSIDVTTAVNLDGVVDVTEFGNTGGNTGPFQPIDPVAKEKIVITSTPAGSFEPVDPTKKTGIVINSNPTGPFQPIDPVEKPKTIVITSTPTGPFGDFDGGLQPKGGGPVIDSRPFGPVGEFDGQTRPKGGSSSGGGSGGWVITVTPLGPVTPIDPTLVGGSSSGGSSSTGGDDVTDVINGLTPSGSLPELAGGEATAEELAGLAPAAGADGEFCTVVNTQNSNLCKPGNR